MQRVKAALRALCEDTEPLVGFLTALASGPNTPRRHRDDGRAPTPKSAEEVKRILTWVGHSEVCGPGGAAREPLIRQVLAGLECAALVDQPALRAAVVSQLEGNGGAALEGALRVAGRLAFPEAKGALLGLLTFADRDKPSAASSSASRRADARGNGAPTRNGHQEESTQGALVLAALARLRDPKLEMIYQAVLSKYGKRATHDSAAKGMCREACLGLAYLHPGRAVEDIPGALLRDRALAERLADVVCEEERRSRASNLNWVSGCR